MIMVTKQNSLHLIEWLVDLQRRSYAEKKFVEVENIKRVLNPLFISLYPGKKFDRAIRSLASTGELHGVD
jgi:hypothetical protein